MCHHNTLRVTEAEVPTRIQRMHVDRVEGKVLYGRGYDDLLDTQYPTTLEMKVLEHGLKKNDEIVIVWFGMQRVVFLYYNKQKAKDLLARGAKLEGETPKEIADNLVKKHGTLETAARRENIGEGTLHAMRKGVPGAGRRLGLVRKRKMPKAFFDGQQTRSKALERVREQIESKYGDVRAFGAKRKRDSLWLMRPNTLSESDVMMLRKNGIHIPHVLRPKSQ